MRDRLSEIRLGTAQEQAQVIMRRLGKGHKCVAEFEVNLAVIDLLEEMQWVASIRRHQLENLIELRNWSAFDDVLALADLPQIERNELLTLKSQQFNAERGEREQTLFDHAKGLIEQRKWNEFDEQVLTTGLPEELQRSLYALKSQQLDEERRENEQALFDHAKGLIELREWDEFDEYLLTIGLPEELRQSLHDLQRARLEEDQRKHELEQYGQLRELIDRRNWSDFNAQFDAAAAELPATLYRKLLKHREEAVESERSELLVNELKQLLTLRRWETFDAKLQHESKWLSSSLRNQLLEDKANALRLLIPETVRPSNEQARILANVAKNIRVKARAGSGKTRLLTALTYFLIKECSVSPNEILLLTFNSLSSMPNIGMSTNDFGVTSSGE
jgi:nitrogen fixation-related uncharacterized protein